MGPRQRYEQSVMLLPLNHPEHDSKGFAHS